MREENSTNHYFDIISIFSDAKGYKRWYETHEIAYENEKRAVRRLELSDCLDIGSGPGIFHEVLGGRIVSFDISEVMLKEISREEDRVQGEAHFLPFRDRSFSCVFISVTICFLKDIESFIKEVSRITKEYLGVCIIAKDTPWGQLYENLGKSGHKYYSRANFITKKEIIKHLSPYFNIEKIVSTLTYRPFENDHLEEPRDDDKGSFICIKAKLKEAF